MELVPCEACGRRISPMAASCPQCGHPQTFKAPEEVVPVPEAKPKTDGSAPPIVNTIVMVSVLVVVWSFWPKDKKPESVQPVPKPFMEQVRDKVATDAVREYGIAKRQGDPIQICVQAGMVAAAYLQAQDEKKYREWKQTQERDCKQ